MQVGSGMNADEPHMGPLVTREHADKVLGYIDQGVSEGATLVVDGRNFVVTGHENGYFVAQPCLITSNLVCGFIMRRSLVLSSPWSV